MVQRKTTKREKRGATPSVKRIAIVVLVGLAILVTGARAMAVRRTPSDLVRQMVDRARVQPAFNGTVQSVDDYSARLATVIVADVTALQVRIADHIDIGTNDAPKLQPGDLLEVRWWSEEYTAVALKRQTTFLPFVVGGSTRVTRVATPQWTTGYPRNVGTDVQGAWGSVPGAIRYDVWRNSSPSPDGAEFVISTDKNFFTVPAGLGEQSELLTNGGFESGALTGWAITMPGGMLACVITSGEKHSGNYAMSCINTNGNFSPSFAVVESEAFDVSFWCKYTEAGSSDLTVNVFWYDINESYLSYDLIVTLGGSTSGWEKQSQVVTAPASAKTARIVIGYTKDTGSSLYIDDVSVIGVTESSSSLLYAVRAVDGSGNASPFSTWLQPLAQSAAVGTAQLVPSVGLMAAAVADQSASKVFATDGSIITLAGGSASAWNEIPSGAINGVNVTFTLAHAPTSGSLRLYQNGLRLRAGASNDYTLSGNTITMNNAPTTGDWLLADYVY